MTESFAYHKCNHIQLIISLVCLFINGCSCLRRQTTFGDANTGFPAKWRLRNEHRNSILMTHHYPDLGSASDWLNQISHAADQSDLSSDASSVWNSCTRFSNVIWGGGGTSGSVAKCCRTFLASSWETSASREKRTVHLTFHYTVMHLTLSLCRLN